MHRRLLLKQTLISTIGYCARNYLPNRITKFRKTDTHVHLFDLDRFRYPWLKPGSLINRTFRWTDFDEATRDANVQKILFMESGVASEFALAEALAISNLALEHSQIHGIIAQIDLSQPLQHSDTFKKLAGIDLLRGCRGKFLPQSAVFVENLKILADHGLTFDLLLSEDQLEQAAAICQKCSQTTFVLDHLGNPKYQEEDMAGWIKGIESLARLPNVNCKVSGMISRIGPNWTLDDLRPFFEKVYHSFGADRLMYGGDWPVVLLSDSYQAWSNAFDELTKRLEVDEREKIFYKNADRIYNI